MSKHKKGHHRKHQPSGRPLRSTGQPRHSRKNHDRELSFLNHFFQNRAYLAKDGIGDQEFTQFLIDLYDAPQQGTLPVGGIAQEESEGMLTGYAKLREISLELDQLREVLEYKRLPLIVAETMATFIELLDLTHLMTLATTHNTTVLLDQLHIRLTATGISEMLPTIGEIEDWLKQIQKISFKEKILRNKREKLTESECEQLQEDISRWMELFKMSLIAI
jgi:hypothetical protein